MKHGARRRLVLAIVRKIDVREHLKGVERRQQLLRSSAAVVERNQDGFCPLPRGCPLRFRRDPSKDDRLALLVGADDLEPPLRLWPKYVKTVGQRWQPVHVAQSDPYPWWRSPPPPPGPGDPSSLWSCVVGGSAYGRGLKDPHADGGGADETLLTTSRQRPPFLKRLAR